MKPDPRKLRRYAEAKLAEEDRVRVLEATTNENGVRPSIQRDETWIALRREMEAAHRDLGMADYGDAERAIFEAFLEALPAHPDRGSEG